MTARITKIDLTIVGNSTRQPKAYDFMERVLCGYCRKGIIYQSFGNYWEDKNERRFNEDEIEDLEFDLAKTTARLLRIVFKKEAKVRCDLERGCVYITETIEA